MMNRLPNLAKTTPANAARRFQFRLGVSSLLPAVLMSLSQLGWATSSLDFNKVFNGTGEPQQIQYTAAYSVQGTTHQVQVWRDRQQHIKRRTDNLLETYVSKGAGETEWQLVTLDLQRRMRTDINRTNLYRIGHFADWFGLANSMAQPPAGYQLHALTSPVKTNEPAVSSCRWYSLLRSGTESKICWSRAAHLPLLITDGNDAVVWRVTELKAAHIEPAIFVINDQGYVRNDANADMEND